MSRHAFQIYRTIPLVLTAILYCIFSALPAASAPQKDWTDGIVFRTPPAFTELADHTSDLFQETERDAVDHGKLIKMYLPQYMAHQYRYGSRDAVTRQILICALESQQRPLDQKDAELLARSTEGLFIGFARVPRNRTDTPAQEQENRTKAIAQALEKGTPLLVDSVRIPSAYLHTFLIHYTMTERPQKSWLSTAMAVAVVPVRDTVLFVTVSSILGTEAPDPHLAWVKETAETFAAMIVTANKPEKK
jgi:hypothetical protein